MSFSDDRNEQILKETKCNIKYKEDLGDTYKSRYSKVITQIEDLKYKPTGIYIRIAEEGDIFNEIIRYCEENNIKNKIIYMDVGYSGVSSNRKALQVLNDDIRENRLKEIVVIKPEAISRKIIELIEFEAKCKENNIKIFYSLDERTKESMQFHQKSLENDERDC